MSAEVDPNCCLFGQYVIQPQHELVLLHFAQFFPPLRLEWREHDSGNSAVFGKTYAKAL